MIVSYHGKFLPDLISLAVDPVSKLNLLVCVNIRLNFLEDCNKRPTGDWTYFNFKQLKLTVLHRNNENEAMNRGYTNPQPTHGLCFSKTYHL